MMIIFAFKKRELKEKTQDANFSPPIKNPNPLLKKLIPDSDSKIDQKLGGFRISDSDCQPYSKYLFPSFFYLQYKSNIISVLMDSE